MRMRRSRKIRKVTEGQSLIPIRLRLWSCLWSRLRIIIVLFGHKRSALFSLIIIILDYVQFSEMEKLSCKTGCTFNFLVKFFPYSGLALWDTNVFCKLSWFRGCKNSLKKSKYLQWFNTYMEVLFNAFVIFFIIYENYESTSRRCIDFLEKKNQP